MAAAGEFPSRRRSVWSRWRAAVRQLFSWLGLSILLCAAIGATPALAQNPVPFLNQPLVPDTAVPGGAAFTLTVNGAGFVSGATVDWNGTALTTTFVSSGQLTAAIPAADIATAGTASVKVVNPGPGGGASNVDFFPVTTATSAVTFSPTAASPIPLGTNAITGPPEGVGIAVADFNGDGNEDLAIPNTFSSNVSVLLGNGDGTFTEATGSPFTVTGHPVGIAVGDINGDGKLDIVATDALNSDVTILLGNGDGTFGAGIKVPTQYEPTDVFLADFNGDGKLDMATASDANHTLVILLGNGDGTFTLASGSPITLTSNAETHFIAVGDFDGDGKLDIAVTNQGENVLILHGNGDGTFSTASTIDMSGSYGGDSIVAGDINHDGKLDLLVAGGNTSATNGGNVVIELGKGDGTFTQSVSSETTNATGSVAMGDLNGDGDQDMAIAGSGSMCDASGSNCQFVMDTQLGNGDGTFQASSFFPATQPLWVAEGDFNNDGRLDLVTLNVNASQNLNEVSILLQQASSTPAPAVTLSKTSMDFGTVAVSTTSAEMTVTVTNSGNADLTFAAGAVTLSGANAGDFSITTDNCSGTTVAANGTCSVGVTFTPTAAGSESASLDFADNAAGSPQSVALSGTGAAPTVSVSPSTLSFSGIDVDTTSSAKTVTLTNTAGVSMTISSIGTGTSDFSESDTCGGSLAAGANCSISVTFKPSASGTRSGTLSIADSATGSPQTVALSGTGEDFGLSATTTSRTVTAGSSASFDLQLSPQSGFTGSVALSCSGAPADSTCTVSPTSVTLDGTNNASATVNVTTTAPSMLFPFTPGPPAMPPATVWVALLGLLGVAFGWLAWRRDAVRGRKRVLLTAPLALLLLAAPFLLSGCNSKRTPTGGTPQGTATLTVTGKSGNLSHSATMTLTVQ